MPTETTTSSSKYDRWNARSGNYPAPNLGPSRAPSVIHTAPSPLPAAGPSRAASTGGALSGSVQHPAHGITHARDALPSCSSSVFPVLSIPDARQQRPNVPVELPTERPLLAVQWNMNGFYNNLADLEILVRDRSPSILAIQEMHNVEPNRLNRLLSGAYRWTTKRGDNLYHSVGIGVASHLPFVRVGAPTDLPAIAVRIKAPITATIVSIYIPNRKEPNLQNRLTEFLESLEEPILFLGDVNGHHPEWGKHRPNRRGIEIMESTESRGLALLNDGSPTFTSGERQSSIDVSFASASLVPRLLWTVSDDSLGSDHHPISIQLDEAPTEVTRRPRWVYKEANWDEYQRTVRRMCDENPPDNIEGLVETIFKAAEETIPRTSPIPGKKALHWWSETTKSAVKARRKALRAWKRLPVEHPGRGEALKNYQERRNTCRSTVRKAKRDSWEGFIDEINPNQTTKDLWTKVNAINGKRRARGMTIEDGNATTRDPVAIVNLLGRYFADLSSLEGYCPEFKRDNRVNGDSIGSVDIPPDEAETEINLPFSMSELSFALSKANGESAGPDEVGYPLLKRLPLDTQLLLLDKINQEWMGESFPNGWKHSLVAPIPKANTPGHAVSHYRPISLTCCASKIMERMANRRLTEFLRTNGLLDDRQHAFRAGRGTNTYFGTMRQALEEAIEEGQHVEVAALDLSKAYNRAWMPGVLHQLIGWGLKGRILSFVKGFTQGRTFQVYLGNHRSNRFKEETGVPQGSVLAVTLFLIKMNGVFGNLPAGIRIFVYADDIVLMVVGATLKALRRKLLQAATYVTRWAKRSGFQISLPKSGFIHLCRLAHMVSRTPLCIDGEKVPRKKTLKILGVTFDRALSFTPHFNIVREGCKSRLNLLKSLAGKHTNANRAPRLLVGKAIINSRLTYGLEVTAMNLEGLKSKFTPVYQNAVRITSGLLPSTPGKAACAEIGEVPFDHFITRAACHRAIGFNEKTSGSNRESCLFDEANRLLSESAGQKLPPVSRVHWCGARGWNLPKTKTDPTIKRQFKAGSNPTAIRRTVTELLRTKYRNHTVRYSDGSFALGRVGIGATGDDLAICNRLPDQCTVFSAEAAAAFAAATTPSNRPIAVLTDSASVVSGLASENIKHPWLQAIQLEAPAETVFIWVPGHSGIPGNEKADHLAAVGRQKALFTNTVPAADLKRWVTKVIKRRWAEEWQCAGRGGTREYFLRKVKADVDRWEDPKVHREQRIMSRLRTGHAGFAYNMSGNGAFKINCEVCRTQHHSVEHVICHCPQYEGPRRTHRIPGSIRDALGNDPTATAALMLFLKETELYQKI